MSLQLIETVKPQQLCCCCPQAESAGAPADGEAPESAQEEGSHWAPEMELHGEDLLEGVHSVEGPPDRWRAAEDGASNEEVVVEGSPDGCRAPAEGRGSEEEFKKDGAPDGEGAPKEASGSGRRVSSSMGNPLLSSFEIPQGSRGGFNNADQNADNLNRDLEEGSPPSASEAPRKASKGARFADSIEIQNSADFEDDDQDGGPRKVKVLIDEVQTDDERQEGPSRKSVRLPNFFADQIVSKGRGSGF